MRDIDAIVTRAYQIGMQQIDSEARWLIDQLDRNPPASILEIGIGTGGTNYLWSECYPAARLASVDIIDQPAWLRGNYAKIDSHSVDIHDALRIYKPFDFIFIDGDHSYEGVRQDFDLALNMITPGGVIALHDIVDSEYHRGHGCYVSRLWADVKAQHFTREITTSNWAGIGLVRIV